MPHERIDFGGVVGPLEVDVLDLSQCLWVEFGVDGRVLLARRNMEVVWDGSFAALGLGVDSQLLWFKRDIMKIGMSEVSLADRTVSMSLEPQRNAFFAELMTTNCQDTDGEGGLADDAHSLLGDVAGIRFLKMHDCRPMLARRKRGEAYKKRREKEREIAYGIGAWPPR